MSTKKAKTARLAKTTILFTLILTTSIIVVGISEEKVTVPQDAIKSKYFSQLSATQLAQKEVTVPKSWVKESYLEEMGGSKELKEKEQNQSAYGLEKVDTYRYEGKTSGIQIVLKKEEGMFPGDWKEDPINAEASNLDEARIERSLKVVKKALDKYPSELLRSNLKRVYVLKSLYFYGVEYGATNSSESVYITNRGIKEGYTDSFLEELVHEEFSSILFRNYNYYFFKEMDWRDVNPDSFSYGEGGRKAIQSGEGSLEINTSWLRKGFLYQYATSDLEEDFNSFARKTFTGKEIWQYAKDYPKIEKKLRLMIDFYHEIDPVFTEEYFRKLN